MKDFEAKFKEWWEVVKEYFTKELEKNMAQHIANERILRYKQDLMEHLKRKKCKLKNHKTSKVEQSKRWRYKQKNHKTLEEGVKKRKNHSELRNKDKCRLF